MITFRRVTLAVLAASLLVLGTANTGWAGETRSDVVGEVDIQAKIDQRVDSENADRQAIQDLLARPEVRKIAGAAGLDAQRVSAAAGVLSGADLKDVAARVHAVTAVNGTVGGVERVTLTVTTIIIILLLIIILAN